MQHKIELTLNSYDMGSAPARAAAAKAFGLNERDLYNQHMRGRPVTLLATLEQFGLFVALRNDLGGTNTIKALTPKLVAPPPPPPTRIDVTQYQMSF